MGGISQEQRAALREAKQFKIETLLHKTTGAVVVLVGEVHFKSKTGAEQGRRLIESFQIIGLEGADDKNYSPLIKVSISVLAAGYELITLIFNLEKSSIEEAINRDQQKTIIHLEDDHVPKWREKCALLFYCSMLLVLLGNELLKFVEYPLPAWMGGLVMMAAIAVIWNIFKIVFGVGVDSSWFVVDRDQTMTKNILRSLEERDSSSTAILVITGRAHVPGIKNSLIQNGFTPLPWK